MPFHTKEGLDNTNWTVKFGEGAPSRSCAFRAKSGQNVRFSEPLRSSMWTMYTFQYLVFFVEHIHMSYYEATGTPVLDFC